MIRIRRGSVSELGQARPGAQELRVDVDGEGIASAIVYPSLVGEVRVGDRVVLNTTAVALGLGTGGFHLVMAVEGRDDSDPGDDEPAGHVMKARYTPVQAAVRSIEETHAAELEASAGLRQVPVVACPLHSMLAPVAAGVARAGRAARLVYVMTDGAALPGAFSRLVPDLRTAGLLETWITTGQSFGGELEAVSLWSGLLAAVEVANADVIVVADGPGNLGTETTWGVSALRSGEVLNAAATLGGRPIPALRLSFSDPRERHRAVSHHSLTILRDVCKVETNVPVPVLEDSAQRAAVWDALREGDLDERHHLVEVDGRPALEELRARGVEVMSMGRTPADDPAFFLAAGAAGVLAGRMGAGNARWREQIVD